MKFQHLRKPMLAKPAAIELLEGMRRREKWVEVSLDLGRTLERVELTPEGPVIRGTVIPWDAVEEIAGGDERNIYFIDEGTVLQASIAGEHFYKLVMTKWGHAPTLEINGIHMHRVVDMYPEEDARLKVRLLGDIRCRSILDICTGLGYTAIAELRAGACRVVSIELDENVLYLASLNPWSRELEDSRVEVIHGDAYEVIEDFREEFHAVVHDPPRLQLAGHLYSEEFYHKIAKALKPGGRIVHYVGQPGIKKGLKIWKGVMERMRSAGFTARYDKKTQCVYGEKIR